MKSGFVGIVGRPNVGKSTLLNSILGEKIAITSAKPQTTRNAVRGIYTRFSGNDPVCQLVFIDTPGVRRFVLHNIASGDLAYYFREFRPLLGKCTYGLSCSHKCEAGCKIQEAVYAGVIVEERYESWCRISDEIESGSWEY